MKIPSSKCLFNADEILSFNQKLGSEISEYYKDSDQDLLLMSVLTGAMMFTSDLMRYITVPMRLDCVRVSRYHDKTQGANLIWHARPNSELKDKRVLLVDDIFDEGETMAELHRFCVAEGASEVCSAVLLDKQHDRRSVEYTPDFVGTFCPDEYVFGYGMDFEGQFRHLADIRYLSADE